MFRSSKKASKYCAVKVEWEGQKFDSKAEFARYQALLLLEKSGAISGLKRQPAFELAPKAKVQGRMRPAIRYVADFEYMQGDKRVIEDVKGMKTPVYILKRHLMMIIHGIEILETK